MLEIPKTLRFSDRVFRLSVISLPFLYYISLVGFLIVIAGLLATVRKTALDSFTRVGLLTVTALMLISGVFAYNRGEAFLQLANFLPFFILFAILPFLLRSFEKLEQVARDLVLASIPINIIAFFEYVLKAPWLPASIQETSWVQWIQSAPHKGRAMVMFDHPNALASYLVLILGLGLGLILSYSSQRRTQHLTNPSTKQLFDRQSFLLYGATYLNLIGIFSSGSRNGILVAISQIVAFSLFVKTSRVIFLSGILSLLSVLAGSAFLGIGGRALSIVDWTDDPRVGVWKIAIDLIQERPWLGWGLGNYKFLYPPRLIDPDYPYIFHPHNFWLLLGSEAGILVMIALTVVVGYICYRGVSLVITNRLLPPQRGILLGYLFSFWGCIAYALFDVTFYDARINIVNWIVLAGIYAAIALVHNPQRLKSLRGTARPN